MCRIIPIFVLAFLIACKGSEPSRYASSQPTSSKSTARHSASQQMRTVMLRNASADKLLLSLASDFSQIGVSAKKDADSNAIVLRGTLAQIVRGAGLIERNDKR